MKVLVTGASGMTGRALVTALIARGDTVTVLQRRPAGLDTAEVLGDIADAELVRRAATGHEAVLHLAAKVDVVGPWADYQRVNVDGTRSVVAACRAAGVGPADPRLVAVGRARRGGPGRRRGRTGRPGSRAQQLLPVQGASPSRSRWPPTAPSWPCCASGRT